MKDVIILNPGQRLKEIRKSLKLKQEELAGDKFSKNYISMFENNRRAMNAINATYLAEQINKYAEQQGLDYTTTASYLIKSDIDIAKDKCEGWLNEVENNLNLSYDVANLNLYKTIILSSKYNLVEFRGRALYLKGLNAMNNELYACSIPMFLEALVYFSKDENYTSLSDIFMNIGLSLYHLKNWNQANTFLNISLNMLKRNTKFIKEKEEEIRYYKGLCHLKLGEYSYAQKDVSGITIKNSDVIKLINQINDGLIG